MWGNPHFLSLEPPFPSNHYHHHLYSNKLASGLPHAPQPVQPLPMKKQAHTPSNKVVCHLCGCAFPGLLVHISTLANSTTTKTFNMTGARGSENSRVYSSSSSFAPGPGDRNVPVHTHHLPALTDGTGTVRVHLVGATTRVKSRTVKRAASRSS